MSNAFLKKVLIACLLAGLAGCASTTRQDVSQYVDDSQITAKVKTAMARDKEVSARRINVETQQGVVQLSGFAKSPQEAEHAVTLARSVQGVQSVRNDIVIE